MGMQNPPAEADHCFSPTPFRFVHAATPAVRSQGGNHPLTVLAFVAFALQRNGSGEYHPRFNWGSSLAVGSCLTDTLLTLSMGISNCRHGYF